MTIEMTSQTKAVVITVRGRMDAESTDEFNSVCDRCIDDGWLYLVLDLSGLQYISSAPLGSVVRLAKKLEAKGGAVLLCGPRGMVREVFEITNLLPLFKVFDSTEAACQSI
jgi:anti-anti-sigma factor